MKFFPGRNNYFTSDWTNVSMANGTNTISSAINEAISPGPQAPLSMFNTQSKTNSYNENITKSSVASFFLGGDIYPSAHSVCLYHLFFFMRFKISSFLRYLVTISLTFPQQNSFSARHLYARQKGHVHFKSHGPKRAVYHLVRELKCCSRNWSRENLTAMYIRHFDSHLSTSNE
eukprot:sb/3472019/